MAKRRSVPSHQQRWIVSWSCRFYFDDLVSMTRKCYSAFHKVEDSQGMSSLLLQEVPAPLHSSPLTIGAKKNQISALEYGTAQDLHPEQELAHSLKMQEMSRLLLDQAGDGIYGLDADGYVTFVNRAAQQMVGWSETDMQGKTQHSIVHHSHADGTPYPREACPIYHALIGNESHYREDEVFWRKDGSSFPVA